MRSKTETNRDSLTKYSRAWHRLCVFVSSSDWFIAMSTSIAIGQSNYFGFGFKVTDRFHGCLHGNLAYALIWNRSKQKIGWGQNGHPSCTHFLLSMRTELRSSPTYIFKTLHIVHGFLFIWPRLWRKKRSVNYCVKGWLQFAFHTKSHSSHIESDENKFIFTYLSCTLF